MMGSFFDKEFESDLLDQGLRKLGLTSERDSLLYFVCDKDRYTSIPEIWFQLEKAELYKANAVFFKKGIKDEYIPQIYIYDFTSHQLVDNKSLIEIHQNVWTGGEIPLACVFSKTEIKILDTTKPIKKKGKEYIPEYLIENLQLIAKGHKVYNEYFAQKLKSGTYWDSSKVSFNSSAYKLLTRLLRQVIDEFTKQSGLAKNKNIIQQLIIQCILIKYLEERKDFEGNTVFPASFFNQYNFATQFSDVLSNGCVFDLFNDLNKSHFNGGIFHWKEEDKKLLIGKTKAFTYLAEVLKAQTDNLNQQSLFEEDSLRFYSFNYIPVELISRIYEEFIIKDEDRKKGVTYTPAHLVRLLVNEAMPLDNAPDNLKDFKLLDPACGSAIFLAAAFKRLVQWWRKNNNYRKPEINDLKKLLSSIYGVDLDPNAVQISIFSLCIALCDELSPKAIWNDLTFDPIKNVTIFDKDFFLWKEQEGKGLKFDIVIGNPPFERGAIKKELNTWTIREGISAKIPQNQIALRFLADSLSLLKENGLSCLIVKALPLLYSNGKSSKIYLKSLTQNFQLNQIFDFTPLARNGVLWDGADVDSAAVFVTNSKPDFSKNVLHAIFRRTKTNTERIYFEIDKYDLHFILRHEVYDTPYIFKINLLGGGRIKNLTSKLGDVPTLFKSKEKYEIEIEEGYEISTGGKNNPDFLYQIPTLPSNQLKKDGIKIDYKNFPKFDRNTEFSKSSKEIVFRHPNILIKENIDLPIIFNDKYDFTYPRKIIGIASKNRDKESLIKLYNILVQNKKLYKFFIAVTSGQVLVLKNSALYFEDIKRLPIIEASSNISNIEENVMNDVLEFTQYFIRTPDKSLAIKHLNNIKAEVGFYGNEFSYAINELYADGGNSFKLTDIIQFEKEGLIGALFSYDKRKDIVVNLREESEISGLDGLVNFDINESLTATRIIQYYAANKVLFVKPNQKRYWLASIAYRDADSVFADILNNQ